MTPYSCVPCTTTLQAVSVPGTEGIDAFTTTTANFVVPALGAQVTIDVVNSDWMNVGNTYFITGAGWFSLDNINSQTSITLTYLNITANTAAGNTTNSGAKVTAAGVGSNGQDGISVTTVTTADFIIPANGSNVSAPDAFIHVASTAANVAGQKVFISDGTFMGSFLIIAVPSTLTLTAQFLGYIGDSNPASTIATGASVIPTASQPPTVVTTTTADFTIPAIGANVSVPDGFIHVETTAAYQVGETLFVSDGADWGAFEIITLSSSTTFVAKFLGHIGDSAPAAVIDSGATVTPTGTQPPLSGALPTAFTDNSTGTPSDTIAAGVGISTFAFQTLLADIADGDLMTDFPLGYKFKILAFDFVTESAATTPAKQSTIHLEIGATPVTGGVISLTSASCTPKGVITAGTAVTALNTGAATDLISIVAATTSTFIQGSGTFYITVQNMDSADSIASLADHLNDVLVALTP